VETRLTATEEERKALDCGFAEVQRVFDDCLTYARSKISAEGITAYIAGARAIGKMGRGHEPVLAFLEEMPDVAAQLGEDVIPFVVEFTLKLSRTPNAKAIAPFLQSLAAAARALESQPSFWEYLQLVWQTMERTMPKVHGIDSMYSSPCLPDFLKSVPFLFSQLSFGGLRNWVDYGVKAYPNDPDRQCDFFSLQSADSRAVLQRERHGTLLTDHERKLDLYLRSLWTTQTNFIPYSLAFDELRKPVPYLDNLGIHLPDVYDDTSAGVRGIDRYRALLAHVTAHQRWTTWQVADNFSPFQRMAVEVFEDSRVETLAMREYPGLRNLWCALHPIPKEDACPEGWSAIRHRLYMLSRALLDPEHSYRNPVLLKYVARFHEVMASAETRTDDMVQLGLSYIAETRVQSDQSAKMWFADTEVDYRDDNRLMWRYIEEGDEEEDATRPSRQQRSEEDEDNKLPPRLYPEWDYSSQHYRPDWVSVYEHLHPKGDANFIDQLLLKHSALAKRLKKIIDLLKPHQKVRIRYQEEGSELDLDIAIRSLIDFKSGAMPDPRINMSHKHDGRSVAVSLLVDLSASLADVPEGCEQSKLELSQEAVSLLAWAVDQMGDPFAIGGFHSNTRHEVRYLHIKGYRENWGPEVKSRLAAMDAGYSTRMGAAMRHAGHYLDHQQADKKLLLILTDGEPSDIDAKDERLLIEDARIAVRELDQKGIYTYCINLDPKADEYVADIFGSHYAVIDNIARLPERLPQLFMSLTK
jgi:nitric oxide reductase NorD protein